MDRDALVVVDVQEDFIDGALGGFGGGRVVEPINRLLRIFAKKHSYIAATRDWHPPTHKSFKVWPVHCLQNSGGARFANRLLTMYCESIFSKGENDKYDGYSGVEGTLLVPALRVRGCKLVYVVGLATDYCVKFTVLDLLKEGFEVVVVADCCAAVNLQEGDGEAALQAMRDAGATVIPTFVE